MKSLYESLFDKDILEKPISINGVDIYMPDWKLAEKYYQKRREKCFGRKINILVLLGDLDAEFEVVYNENDCVIAVDYENDVYVLSPETIYMNHTIAEQVNGRNYVWSLNNINEANDFDICFGWNGDIHRWMTIGDSRDHYGYIPETISDKAKSVIKKYIR